MIRLSTIVLAVGALQFAGCASIVNGQNQSVSVETRTESGPVAGANCKLTNNKGTWFVTTPGSTTVQRSFEDLAVRCDKEAHEPGLTSVKSTTKAMAFGNIIFGGIIGAGVDMSTGAAYDYPSLISVTMPMPAAAAASSPAAPKAEVVASTAPATAAAPAAAASAPAK